MKLTIERGSDPILASTYYSLKVGTRVYHYEKLADILYRIAVMFEPPDQEMTKPEKAIKVPKRKYTKRSGKFPLGEAIVQILNSTEGYVSLDTLMGIKTTRPYSKSVWAMVLANLVKRKAIRVVIDDGETKYGRIRGK